MLIWSLYLRVANSTLSNHDMKQKAILCIAYIHTRHSHKQNTDIWNSKQISKIAEKHITSQLGYFWKLIIWLEDFLSNLTNLTTWVLHKFWNCKMSNSPSNFCAVKMNESHSICQYNRILLFTYVRAFRKMSTMISKYSSIRNLINVWRNNPNFLNVKWIFYIIDLLKDWYAYSISIY